LQYLTDIWQNLECTLSIRPEEMELINDLKMQEIKGNIKVIQCLRLETIQEGTELIITGIKRINHRNKARFIIQFENIKQLYLSNYWLEKEIEYVNIDLNFKIKVMFDQIKIVYNKQIIV
jgi:hypothetical protein